MWILLCLKTVDQCVLSLTAGQNVLSDPIVKYMAVSEAWTLFLQSVATGDISHNANWIAEDFGRVIRGLKTPVCGAITDNTRANTNDWMLLQNEFPDKFFFMVVRLTDSTC